MQGYSVARSVGDTEASSFQGFSVRRDLDMDNSPTEQGTSKTQLDINNTVIEIKRINAATLPNLAPITLGLSQ